MAKKTMPSRARLEWATLDVLKNVGGSASIQEISEHVTRNLDLPDDVADIPHGDGPQTELDYRLAWIRTGLKSVGAVDNKTPGIWTITPAGRAIGSKEDLRSLFGQKPRGPSRPERAETSDDRDWKDDLLVILRDLEPDAFERLCQRILRESGFTKVVVTGRSGDGGIDGAGVLRVNLISFHVLFQSKRYAGSVQVREIRDFRGAMVGRADKGLFMTTGRFTSGAKREAARDGAPAIDLIDGVALCGLLKELKLGVSTELVESTKVHPEFFTGL